MKHAPIALLASFVMLVSFTGCTFTARGRAPLFLGARSAVSVRPMGPVRVSVSQPATRVVVTQAPSQNLCSVEAGPLWSNQHAQSACHGVCERAGAQRFTGQWWTTRWGQMSVCQCAFDAGAVCAPVDDRPHDAR